MTTKMMLLIDTLNHSRFLLLHPLWLINGWSVNLWRDVDGWHSHRLWRRGWWVKWLHERMFHTSPPACTRGGLGKDQLEVRGQRRRRDTLDYLPHFPAVNPSPRVPTVWFSPRFFLSFRLISLCLVSPVSWIRFLVVTLLEILRISSLLRKIQI